MTLEKKEDCKHDFDNPVRTGRCRYRCRKCADDISTLVMMLEEAKVVKAP